MPRVNFSEWSIQHRVLVAFFTLLILIAGVRAYFSLGQNEDPPFTFKTMVVKAYLPGATMEETLDQLTDRIEKKLQETPFLDYLKSYTLPGQTTIFICLLSRTDKADVPETWYQVRKKIGDIRHELPAETVGPFFNDEFGDTYSIIYAFTADGFTHRQLKDAVENIRNDLLHVQDVSKIATIGAQSEKYYVEFSPHKLATLGIPREALLAALQRQNALVPSGVVDTGRERVSVETTGRFSSAEDIEAVTIYVGERKIRLGDIAVVTRGYADPPEPRFRYNGRDAVGLGIAMRNGGNVLEMERNISRAMERLREALPAGIEGHLVANQPIVVRGAVREFTKSLFEAVVIVLMLGFIILGLRAGAVVACSIPVVLASVFLGMEILGIDLQRVSLGALIISLGLLMDDAIITVESMLSKAEEGWPLEKAATFSFTSTAIPMVTGTLITIFGFIPVGLARSTSGEYCFSLFVIIALALLSSWFVAVLVAPTVGLTVLRRYTPRKSRLFTAVSAFFHRFVLLALRHPKTTVALTIALFALSLAALPLVPRQFFPPSDRPELLVDMTLRQGVSIYETDAVSKRLDALLARDPGVDHWSSYVGQGAVRFYLPLDQQLPNDFFAQTVVVTKGGAVRDEVRARLEHALENDFPELYGRVNTLEMGPPVGWPVSYRVSGPEIGIIKRVSRELAQLMAASPKLRCVSFNWGEPSRKLRIQMRQDEARRLGLSSSAVAQLVYSTVSGITATQIRDDIYLVDVVLRADEASRTSLENLRSLDVPVTGGRSVPLSAVAEVDYVQDAPLIWRRDRLPTVTVQADVAHGIMAETAVSSLKAEVDALRARLPEGYAITDGGTVEESAKSEGAVAETLPIMFILILCVLMIQLQSFKDLFLVLLVVPLGLIGVVAALMTAQAPLGYIALLGIMALMGMIVRNSVILVHQIGIEKAQGRSDWEAVAAAAEIRVRPIILTAITTIMGMVPIAPTGFWGPMAYAVMGGLAVATVLTLIFLPACYALCYRIRAPRP